MISDLSGGAAGDQDSGLCGQMSSERDSGDEAGPGSTVFRMCVGMSCCCQGHADWGGKGTGSQRKGQQAVSKEWAHPSPSSLAVSLWCLLLAEPNREKPAEGECG